MRHEARSDCLGRNGTAMVVHGNEDQMEDRSIPGNALLHVARGTEYNLTLNFLIGWHLAAGFAFLSPSMPSSASMMMDAFVR